VKRVIVRPAAAADIQDAYRWYESRRGAWARSSCRRSTPRRLVFSNIQKRTRSCTALPGARPFLAASPTGSSTESTVTPSSDNRRRGRPHPSTCRSPSIAGVDARPRWTLAAIRRRSRSIAQALDRGFGGPHAERRTGASRPCHAVEIPRGFAMRYSAQMRPQQPDNPASRTDDHLRRFAPSVARRRMPS